MRMVSFSILTMISKPSGDAIFIIGQRYFVCYFQNIGNCVFNHDPFPHSFSILHSRRITVRSILFRAVQPV